MYGIESAANDDDNAEADEDQDIEASIEAELRDMKSKQKPDSKQVFTPVSSGIECLFFMKTTDPVEPEALAKKMCEDARDCPDPRQRKCKYINRLTPVLGMEKATENGVVEVARLVLSPWFHLNDEVKDDTDKTEGPPSAALSSSSPYTVCIMPR